MKPRISKRTLLKVGLVVASGGLLLLLWYEPRSQKSPSKELASAPSAVGERSIPSAAEESEKPTATLTPSEESNTSSASLTETTSLSQKDSLTILKPQAQVEGGREPAVKQVHPPGRVAAPKVPHPDREGMEAVKEGEGKRGLSLLIRSFEKAFLEGDTTRMREVVEQCDQCSTEVRSGLLVFLSQAADLPHLVRQLKARKALEREGWFTPEMDARFFDLAKKRADTLLSPLVQQGEHLRIRAILGELEKAGLRLKGDSKAFQVLHEQAEALFHSGYTLERVNAEGARAKYQEALRLAPPGDPLAEKIQRRLDALR